jgi:hypothetical protein
MCSRQLLGGPQGRHDINLCPSEMLGSYIAWLVTDSTQVTRHGVDRPGPATDVDKWVFYGWPRVLFGQLAVDATTLTMPAIWRCPGTREADVDLVIGGEVG